MKNEKYERLFQKASELIASNPDRKEDGKWIFDMICNDDPNLWIDNAVLRAIVDAIEMH